MFCLSCVCLSCGKHLGWKVRAFCQGSVYVLLVLCLPFLWQTSGVESESFLLGVCLHFACLVSAFLVANIRGGK